jgi:hypothetical protein
MTPLDNFEARLAEATRNRDEFAKYAQGIINQMCAHIDTLQEVVNMLREQKESNLIPIDNSSAITEEIYPNGVPKVNGNISQDGD